MRRHGEEKTGRTDQFEECSKALEGQNPSDANQREYDQRVVVKSGLSEQATFVQVEIVTSPCDEK